MPDDSRDSQDSGRPSDDAIARGKGEAWRIGKADVGGVADAVLGFLGENIAQERDVRFMARMNEHGVTNAMFQRMILRYAEAVQRIYEETGFAPDTIGVVPVAETEIQAAEHPDTKEIAVDGFKRLTVKGDFLRERAEEIDLDRPVAYKDYPKMSPENALFVRAMDAVLELALLERVRFSKGRMLDEAGEALQREGIRDIINAQIDELGLKGGQRP